MSANLNGASIEDSVAAMRERREQPSQESDLNETTGGTEEAQQEPQETESFELEAEVDGSIADDVDDEPSQELERRIAKVDGEELELTFDEAIEGYMKEQHFRKGTMANADTRKALEAEQTAMAERVQKLESLIGETNESIDWQSLQDSDPHEYIRLKNLQDDRQATLETEQVKQSEQAQKQRQGLIDVETKKLVEHMGPTWIDDKRTKTFDEANAYLESMGVSQEESSNFIDSRLWKMIFDATEYQKIKGNKSKVSEQIQSAPKSVKPGTQRRSRSQTEVESARAKLKGSNKGNELDNAVAYMKAKRGKK